LHSASRTVHLSCTDALIYGDLTVHFPFITYSSYLIYSLSSLSARQFDPDRFLDSRLKTYLIPNPFIFVPFSAGPRICPGQQFAYNEMEYFLVRLLQTFSEFSIDWKTQPESSKTPASWIPTDEPENIGYEVGLTMSVKVYFILFHRVSSYVGGFCCCCC